MDLEAGFTLTELIIASAAAAVIMTAAVSLLVQWQHTTASSEGDLNAIADGTRAIGQIADDVRLSTYLYHYATISITDNTGTLFTPTATTLTFPIVTQGSTADNVPGNTNPQPFFNGRSATDMMGASSSGAIRMLAMISDQPNGLNQPRYIVYWVGQPIGQITQRTDGAKFNLYPLYRLEASPSAANAVAPPTSWYTFRDAIATSSATSGFSITLNAGLGTSRLTDYSPAPKTLSVNYKFQRLANIVLGNGITDPFTLRNPHPYSNASLISPYEATVSILTARVPASGSIRGAVDFYRLSTKAFARNVPLPQQGS